MAIRYPPYDYAYALPFARGRSDPGITNANATKDSGLISGIANCSKKDESWDECCSVVGIYLDSSPTPATLIVQVDIDYSATWQLDTYLAAGETSGSLGVVIRPYSGRTDVAKWEEIFNVSKNRLSWSTTGSKHRNDNLILNVQSPMTPGEKYTVDVVLRDDTLAWGINHFGSWAYADLSATVNSIGFTVS